MTPEEFFEQENIRNNQNQKTYKSHLKKVEELQKRQVEATEKMVGYLDMMVKKVVNDVTSTADINDIPVPDSVNGD